MTDDPLDRMIEAEQAGEGIWLSPNDVADVLEELAELELRLTLERVMAAKQAKFRPTTVDALFAWRPDIDPLGR
tara:strand:+ start:3204 stop:3425 length:222 start_codon:yes stop_codon:yes gene_type:complete